MSDFSRNIKQFLENCSLLIFVTNDWLKDYVYFYDIAEMTPAGEVTPQPGQDTPLPGKSDGNNVKNKDQKSVPVVLILLSPTFLPFGQEVSLAQYARSFTDLYGSAILYSILSSALWTASISRFDIPLVRERSSFFLFSSILLWMS